MRLLKECKKNMLIFLRNKKYITCLILTSILSYGFMLTHYSIGIDDLCLDRYVDGTYILSAGRFGTWLIYKLLNINSYIPFWVDFISVLLLLFTALLLCSFIKFITKDKLKDISYILFTCAYISFPVITNFMVYLPTKLTVVISNLIIVFILIIIYNEHFIKNNIKIYFKLLPLLVFAISMYESCCQTYIVLMFIVLFLYNLYNKKLKWKDILLFIIKVLSLLIISITLYFGLSLMLYKVLDYFNVLELDYSNKYTIIHALLKGENIIDIFKFKYYDLINNKSIISFLILIIISLIMNFKEHIKRDNKSIILFLLIILSNFILFILLYLNLYRMYYSWILTFSFILLYLCNRFKKNNVIIMLCFIVILFNTKISNQLYYNDYRGYLRDVNYTNYIVNNIYNNVNDTTKPILFISSNKYLNTEDLFINYENKVSIYDWGIGAFNEDYTEIIKFINHQGYNFKLVNDYDKYYQEYMKLDYTLRNKDVIELDDFIVVKISSI